MSRTIIGSAHASFVKSNRALILAVFKISSLTALGLICQDFFADHALQAILKTITAALAKTHTDNVLTIANLDVQQRLCGAFHWT